MSKRFDEVSLATGRCARYLSVLARHGMWSWLRSMFPVCVTRHKREGTFLPGTFSLNAFACGGSYGGVLPAGARVPCRKAAIVGKSFLVSRRSPCPLPFLVVKPAAMATW